ncbi:ABC transporter ATP-binding protein [Actinopolyspora mortivallis]|uniref:ABC transporter ATP-binding protein n=1 Tax=Actinopolyspora mortivallis TaxID=33906 RepID=UPI001C62B23D|nr:ABC transporter ATP-binding protein [Actinopolyspora mortivallis]
MRILRELARGKRGQVVLIGFLAAVSAVATLVLPLFVGRLIAAIQRADELTGWAVVLVAAGFGSATAGAGATYLLSKLGLRLIYRLRARTMRHSFGLRLADAREEGSGNLATRLTADAVRLKTVIDIGPIQLPMAVFTVLGTLVIMGLLDWVLLLVTVGAFAIAVAIISVVVVGLRRKYVAVQEEVGALTRHFVAALDSLTIIKACRAESRVADGLAERAERAAKLDIAAARMESLMVPVINLGQQIALVSVVVGGGARMVGGQLTLADFVSFLVYLLQLTAPLIMTASGVGNLQVGLMARKRFDDLFAKPVEYTGEETRGETELPDCSADTPAVRFEAVNFSYDERPVLREVDLWVPARGLTAMVGLSGSGKTTALGLIERFMKPDSGTIRVFGREQDAWSLDALRRQVAYVDQEATLVHDTVRNNLVLGKDGSVDEEELWSALERVGLDGEVSALPYGIDTRLDGVTELSGGQRQRLALARAVLADARLVLLDEPSSQLDSVNEQKLREVVDSLAADRAVLVVAHRISTVQHADHVIVLDSGRIVEQGSHDHLLRDCTEYAELVSGQMLTDPDRATV